MRTTSDTQGQTMGTDAAVSPEMLSPNELLLNELDQGTLFAYLEHLREKAMFIPPTEMYLLLNPASVYTTAEQHYARGARFLEKCRNICVLVPLLLTWFGLSIASELYAQTIALDQTKINEPFLKMWVDGFPTLPSATFFGTISLPPFLIHLPFSGIAAIDVLLFLMLIYLTWCIQHIESKAQAKAHALSAWVREELFILESQSMVIRSQGSERDLALDRVSALMAEMQKVVASFNGAVQQQADGLTQLIKGASRIATAADRLDVIFERGQVVYNRLDATLPHLERQFNTMADRQSEAATALQSIANDMNGVATSIEELARPFATAGLGQMAKTLYRQQQQATQETVEILQKQEMLVKRMNVVSSRMSQMRPLLPKQNLWRVIFNKLLGK